ncbi:tRNA (adenosine(37)-N6)-threonylcarbamoyltransferase complex dimerization subunit type 1 TsaB [Lentilactobacillus senioris]|uniref:tRNA (adenosine(37)-N6)-threonylcarbamoyltransferase complex dimerization subunit type 1 TsaB n=1 Tax=Lentilactobacillus senioris TaxID=931534 RepID=UPI002281F8C5|nr:tRNA (adenosine(37)-N6)-threonylcarbamoyltransferase complex dimerization subunit type 1 TsaB [Lentilactobacillus senioris]MCY9807169.1 tRNA (adenosine(37)-N6)-threonylcarbamoyltransferase complex dimerization subunit type 1 TsaB [Lentilactobacillus senioris]
MKILALDTSNQPLSVAVLVDGKMQASETLTTHKKHAEFLLPVIEDLVSKSGLQPAEIDRVVAAVGPGSYTGIRMATTFAKSFASTLDKELVAVSSLLALALNIRAENVLINPMFDGRNQNMFTGLYQWQNGQLKAVVEDQHTNVNDWLDQLTEFNLPIVMVGEIDNFVEPYQEILGDRVQVTEGLQNIPNAALLAEYGQQLEPIKNVDSLEPRYLRLTKAEADWQAAHPDERGGNYVEKV